MTCIYYCQVEGRDDGEVQTLSHQKLAAMAKHKISLFRFRLLLYRPASAAKQQQQQQQHRHLLSLSLP